jgi:hypothetical protein
MGLNDKQANCAADKVESTIGWAQLSENLLDPGKPGQLQELLVGCVKS